MSQDILRSNIVIHETYNMEYYDLSDTSVVLNAVIDDVHYRYLLDSKSRVIPIKDLLSFYIKNTDKEVI